MVSGLYGTDYVAPSAWNVSHVLHLVACLASSYSRSLDSGITFLHEPSPLSFPLHSSQPCPTICLYQGLLTMLSLCSILPSMITITLFKILNNFIEEKLTRINCTYLKCKIWFPLWNHHQSQENKHIHHPEKFPHTLFLNALLIFF